jgi:hypothetical protein
MCTILALSIYNTPRRLSHPALPPAPLPLNVFRHSEDNKRTNATLRLHPHDTLFYVDAWRSHWCPYYNDRAVFLTPRINELLHLARSRGFRAFHLHWKGHEKKIDERLRKLAKSQGQNGETEIIRETWADNNVNNSRYIPGFKDKCLYPGYERFGPVRCQKPNPAIAVSTTDLVALNFKSIANIANFLNVSTVLLMGMHTNLCIRSAAMYLALVNISVVYVDDFLDSSYYFPGQVWENCGNHTTNNEITFKYAITYHGWGASGYDLVRSLLALPPSAAEPEWLMYPERADAFKRFYRTEN